jgi:LmbE family N-acetylglucosaminyl deacetylase
MPDLDHQHVNEITKHVYKRFPEMQGSRPVVQVQNGTPARTTTKEPNFVITYHATARSAKGNAIQRHVRVVTDYRGKIIRMTTSR